MNETLFWQALEQPLSLLLLAMVLEWWLPIPVSWRPSALVPGLSRLARKVNPKGRAATQQQIAGLLTPVVILLPALLAYWSLSNLAVYEPALELLVLLWLLESRPIKGEQLALTQLLKAGKLSMARLQLGRWCQRETGNLSQMGTCKAAAEMVALRLLGQWFGVAIWYLLLGLPGALAFRLLQLMSQAFSPKRPQNRLFGEFSTRLYRTLLSVPGLLLAWWQLLFPGGGAAAQALWKQARHWPAFGSGALLAALGAGLNLQLGGPRFYAGQKVRLARIGGQGDPGPLDIGRVRRRLSLAAWSFILLLAGFNALYFYAHHHLAF